MRPYPCRVGNPIALRKVPTSLSNGPPPETKAWSAPPNCDFIFFLTILSNKKSLIKDKIIS